MPLQGQKGRSFATAMTRLAQAMLVALVVCFSLGATDAADHFNKLGGKLMCNCGCAQQLLGCDHVGCPDRASEMDQLRSGIASGQSDELILQGFVQRYGAGVLAAPTMQGFNLIAWIMPFAVSIVALGGTIWLVRNWARHHREPAAAPPLSPAQARCAEVMRDRIRRETEGL